MNQNNINCIDFDPGRFDLKPISTDNEYHNIASSKPLHQPTHDYYANNYSLNARFDLLAETQFEPIKQNYQHAGQPRSCGFSSMLNQHFASTHEVYYPTQYMETQMTTEDMAIQEKLNLVNAMIRAKELLEQKNRDYYRMLENFNTITEENQALQEQKDLILCRAVLSPEPSGVKYLQPNNPLIPTPTSISMISTPAKVCALDEEPISPTFSNVNIPAIALEENQISKINSRLLCDNYGNSRLRTPQAQMAFTQQEFMLKDTLTPIKEEYQYRESFDEIFFKQYNNNFNFNPTATPTFLPFKPDYHPDTFNGSKYMEDLYKKKITFNIYDVSKVVLNLCLHKEGSRLIQDKIDDLDEDEFNVLFEGIKAHLNQVSKDQSGNYCIQKILEVKSDVYVDEIITAFESDIVQLCVNNYGSKVIQKSYEILKLEYRRRLSDSVMAHPWAEIRRIIDDQFGNHVIQKILEKGYTDDIMTKKSDSKHSDEFTQIIKQLANFMGGVHNRVYELATNSLGCRVIQKLLECIPCHFLAENVYPEIMQNTSNLAEDKYGNYVIQHILQYSEGRYVNETIGVVKNHIYELACQKFSSNVVQECFKKSSNYNRNQLLEAILALEHKQIIDLMKHMYGNYVVQTALDYATWRQKKIFVQIGFANKELLKMVRYGKFIYKRLEDFQRELKSDKRN